MKEKCDDFEVIFKYDTVKAVYDNTEVIGIPTNNWKKMHKIPIKAKGEVFYENISLGPTKKVKTLYISDRNHMKKRMVQYRHFLKYTEYCSLNEPELIQLKYRYLYSPKKYHKKYNRMKWRDEKWRTNKFTSWMKMRLRKKIISFPTTINMKKRHF